MLKCLRPGSSCVHVLCSLLSSEVLFLFLLIITKENVCSNVSVLSFICVHRRAQFGSASTVLKSSLAYLHPHNTVHNVITAYLG
jgi:hypothetical protein